MCASLTCFYYSDSKFIAKTLKQSGMQSVSACVCVCVCFCVLPCNYSVHNVICVTVYVCVCIYVSTCTYICLLYSLNFLKELKLAFKTSIETLFTMHAVQNFDGGRFLTIGLIWHANSSWGKTFNWKNFDKLHTSCQNLPYKMY